MDRYFNFCRGRTPNWTLTYRFLQRLERLGRLPQNTSEVMRKGREAATETLTDTPPLLPLLQVYALAMKSGALLFLAHAGELAARLSAQRVDAQLTAMPNLLLDLTESQAHSGNSRYIAKSTVATKRLTAPTLIGTDFHRVAPSPVRIPQSLRGAFGKALLKSMDSSLLPASSLLVNPTVLILSVFRASQIAHVAPVWQAASRMTCEEWVDSWNSHAAHTRSDIEDIILGLGACRHTFAQAAMERLKLSSRRRWNGRFQELLPQSLLEQARSTRDPLQTAWILGVADLAIRLGFYPLYDHCVASAITRYPLNLQRAYRRAPDERECSALVVDLDRELQRADRPSYRSYRLIWRRKSLASAFTSIAKALLVPSESRIGLSVEAAGAAAKYLLRSGSHSNGLVTTDCYNDLIYDHLGISILVRDDSASYAELLRDLALPAHWRVEASETAPRNTYHHRAWLLIDHRRANGRFRFELLIKRDTDFRIGRAYHWYQKGCRLALSTSPWRADGSFDRAKAETRLKDSASIIDTLSQEVQRWLKQSKRRKTQSPGTR
ncbi:MAG TPA: hypothetical protein VHR45_00105 [Thermoanaerobaculia bacterium]|nr:hypothetical protein [Thermoanaerobaculia bacterium]